MFFRRKPTPNKMTRQQTLAAQIVCNPKASERVTDAGNLELTLALPPAKWTRWLGQKQSTPVIRKSELDELGRYVWQQCSNSLTVEQLIRRFAQEHHINLREAEVSVLAFLQTLMKRGLVGVVHQNVTNRP